MKNHVMLIPSNYVRCSGQIESMINYSKVCPDYCFYKFFNNGNDENENFITTAPTFLASSVGNFSYARMFENCTNLKQAPYLPAMKMSNSSCFAMFSGCTGLVRSMNELPATEIGESCYQEMFQYCSSLTKTVSEIILNFAPLKAFRNMFYGTAITKSVKLTIPKMGEQACYNMYGNCSKLTTATALPAKEIDQWSYSYMFSGCTALTSAPELPATILAHACYRLMFNGCTALTSAPGALPAAELTTNCYDSMFLNCSSLEKSPVINATVTENAESACLNMFSGCTSLKEITVKFNSWNTTDENGNTVQFTTDWVKGVNSVGIFDCPTDLPVIIGDSNIPANFVAERQPLTFIAQEEAVWVELRYAGTVNTDGLYYKTNSMNDWAEYTPRTGIPLYNIGDSISFKKTNTELSIDVKNYFNFNTYGKKVKAVGNVNSMLNWAEEIPAGGCTYLFNNQSGLIEAPKLTATKLNEKSYNYMFNGCTSLVKAPYLPAAELGKNCYGGMFANCKSLTQAPDILSNEAAEDAFNTMFDRCTSLVTPPKIMCEKIGKNACFRMFQNCTSLVEMPVLNATQLSESSYNSMFINCTGLTKAYDLPAIDVPKKAYYSMFHTCTSLKQAPKISGENLSQQAYAYMFNGCSSLITAPVLNAMNIANYCYHSMFQRMFIFTKSSNITCSIK